MSQKVKSLIYLTCFVATALIYYNTSNIESLDNTNGMEVVDADFDTMHKND